MKPLNIFYKEPDPDRWFKYDRYPRRIIRRIIRGKLRPGGVMMVATELLKGLDVLGIQYRFNDFKYADNHPDELVGIIGKPQLLYDRKWKNPIIFGAGIFSHPVDSPELFLKYPNVKKVLVPGEWMKIMFESYYGDKVISWPVGIDTQKWNLDKKVTPEFDILIYYKIRWDHKKYDFELLNPIIEHLNSCNLSFEILRYGKYNHNGLLEKLAQCKFVIFICEHETQGLAYQQILSTNRPILAWDRGGIWKDPNYFPALVKYEPVSSVPYWDDSCGEKFVSFFDFPSKLTLIISKLDIYNPRKFIENNLSLEICTKKYVDIYNSVQDQLINK